MESFDKLKQAVVRAEADVVKAGEGQKAASRRVRKAMQEIKGAAQEVRREALTHLQKGTGDGEREKEGES